MDISICFHQICMKLYFNYTQSLTNHGMSKFSTSCEWQNYSDSVTRKAQQLHFKLFKLSATSHNLCLGNGSWITPLLWNFGRGVRGGHNPCLCLKIASLIFLRRPLSPVDDFDRFWFRVHRQLTLSVQGLHSVFYPGSSWGRPENSADVPTARSHKGVPLVCPWWSPLSHQCSSWSPGAPWTGCTLLFIDVGSGGKESKQILICGCSLHTLIAPTLKELWLSVLSTYR